ncbi:hypothetical protein MUK42_25027 [Musa troglodytarum]|uniref:Uncharacterized protein n=1 Tax=Musa troglodytarum TaxID=320322 RepID=A0A9E7L8V9_9LILI|nr:hypothetical protein MUK42_25027 [Musa troglodytarum]URE42238.1 hypothetical protein MUK42_25027 [Musa troglodytarum]
MAWPGSKPESHISVKTRSLVETANPVHWRKDATASDAPSPASKADEKLLFSSSSKPSSKPFAEGAPALADDDTVERIAGALFRFEIPLLVCKGIRQEKVRFIGEIVLACNKASACSADAK